MVDFAGWQMPVQYVGIRQEHLAVRNRAGIFDVSHMGQIETRGPDAARLLQRLLTNDIASLEVGRAQYSLLCREDGGVLDDLFTYRLAPDHYLTVTNAANHDRDVRWFRTGGEAYDVVITDGALCWAMLAVQGPQARNIVAREADAALPARHTVARCPVAKRAAVVCGTGYTGEDGVEILCDPDDAGEIWDRLVDAGAEPAGLGARDTLRLEVGYHLYGNDLSQERGPIAAGLGWCCKEETGFIGADAVRADRKTGPHEQLVAFKMTSPGIARHGDPICGGGVVTSGTMSPSLGIAIGMAYVPARSAVVGRSLHIDVRGKRRDAIVAQKPLYVRPEVEP